MIDNRDGPQGHDFSIAVNACREESASATAGTPSARVIQRQEITEKLEKIERSLKSLFVVDNLAIRVARCGTANAFSERGTVIICAEQGQQYLETPGDARRAAGALVFGLLHEVAHVLPEDWGYPFSDNEDVADELSTVLMLMLGLQENVRSQAEYFAVLPPESELSRRLGADVRHPLSVQRARNILRWLGEADLVERWQALLTPHMQTPVLERLRERPPAWADRALVERELHDRRASD